MDYREILKDQLAQRKEMNPKYSLRAFAKKISLSPSKVSEVLSGKKRLGIERAEDIANKLGLASLEKDLFVLSARVESSAKKADQAEIAKQMRELTSQLNAKKASQRNAWYFGAVKALEEDGHDAGLFETLLGITSLQIENAKRYIKRIAKVHPERKQMSFEPTSILKKIEESIFAKNDKTIEADFLLLSPVDQEELERKIKGIIKTYKVKSKKASPKDLHMVYWGSVNLNKE